MARPYHCTLVGLTYAITPNVGESFGVIRVRNAVAGRSLNKWSTSVPQVD